MWNSNRRCKVTELIVVPSKSAHPSDVFPLFLLLKMSSSMIVQWYTSTSQLDGLRFELF